MPNWQESDLNSGKRGTDNVNEGVVTSLLVVCSLQLFILQPSSSTHCISCDRSTSK